MDTYTSQEALIVAKAKEKGIDTAELNAVFERKLRLFTAEFGGDGGDGIGGKGNHGSGRSVAWRLARAEEAVWEWFFPDEPFPMAKTKETSTTKAGEDEEGREELSSPFPKALQGSKSRLEEEYEKVARREWVHDRYQPESPARGSHRVKMERDSYRPVQEIDSYRPKALEENRPVARAGTDKSGVLSSGSHGRGLALRTMPNSSTIRDAAPTSDDSKPYRSQRDLIYQKAVTAGIPREEVEACLEEKAVVAEKKFADRSGDWQIYFVEASTWGRFFKGMVFPGIEPSKHQAQTKMPPAPSVHALKSSPLLEYNAGVSERFMEGKTKSQVERREFFQYLQKMRTYSRLQHPTEACNQLRGWFADNLTWQHFFGPSPYPFAQPPGKISPSCAACLLLPKFAQLTAGVMKKVVSILTAGGPAPKSQVVSSLPSGVPTGPAASRSVISSTSSPAKGAPGQILKPVLAHSSSEKRTTPVQLETTAAEAPKSSLAGVQQLPSNPPNGPTARRDLRTPPPPPATSIRTVPERTESHPQSVAPGRLSAQLAQMWAQDPFLAKGTVVMQNLAPLIFNKTFVGELFNCFASDTKEAIEGIGADLNCKIHYYVISTGDLFLWTEPQTLGDIMSFNRGHVFITGWVARVSSFGMVKPSVHWNAIKPTPAPLQAQPTIPVQPQNTADAFSLLANYVTTATTQQPPSEVREKFTSAQNPSTGFVANVANAANSTSLQVARNPSSAPSKPASRTQLPIKVYPSAFEDPVKQWQRYMAAFRTSDIDRLMVEEAAKNEGDLRMVLDKESGQIVSVEELVKRTVYRCSLSSAKLAGNLGGGGSGGLNGQNGVESGANKKRKAAIGNGTGEDGREKRACV